MKICKKRSRRQRGILIRVPTSSGKKQEAKRVLKEEPWGKRLYRKRRKKGSRKGTELFTSVFGGSLRQRSSGKERPSDETEKELRKGGPRRRRLACWNSMNSAPPKREEPKRSAQEGGIREKGMEHGFGREVKTPEEKASTDLRRVQLEEKMRPARGEISKWSPRPKGLPRGDRDWGAPRFTRKAKGEKKGRNGARWGTQRSTMRLRKKETLLHRRQDRAPAGHVGRDITEEELLDAERSSMWKAEGADWGLLAAETTLGGRIKIEGRSEIQKRKRTQEARCRERGGNRGLPFFPPRWGLEGDGEKKGVNQPRGKEPMGL